MLEDKLRVKLIRADVGGHIDFVRLSVRRF